jgi:hypothetical protein
MKLGQQTKVLEIDVFQNFKIGPKNPRLMFQNHSILRLQKNAKKHVSQKRGKCTLHWTNFWTF